MAKDPAFLFYPGDYLRDTQNLSEKSQVAYDRIMCEHMRNICKDMNNITVSKKQVNFFTKRLSPDEKEELLYILTEKKDTYQIEWVAESIAKRKAYSNSRKKNREKSKENISETYDTHMENEDEIENVIKDEKRKYKNVLLSKIFISDFPELNNDYLEITKAFQELFIKNLKESDVSTKETEQAKGNWIDEIRLLIEKDENKTDDLRDVFKFLQTSDFWKPNILSTKKLRKQFTRLLMEFRKNKKGKSDPEMDEFRKQTVKDFING